MKLVICNHLADEYHRMVRERFPQVEVAAGKTGEIVWQQIEDAEVLLAWKFPIEALERARKLRWIQCTGAGIEHLLPGREQLRDVVVTNARGIHADVMADYTFGAMVMLQWNFPRLFREQQARRWQHRFTEPLAGKTIGVIGLGSIGREIARRGPGFGMTVLGVKRSPGPVEGVSRVVGPDRVREVLPACDFVVLVLPGTAQTRHLVGEPELRAMKRTASLINIGRGSVVDEPALVRALQGGWIAGAALDVFEQEPLPAESPLWAMENVIITPHIAGEPAGYDRRVMEIFADNLARWTKGDPLRNVVDLDRGY
jgi:phosphoglycerate dehydrogenase-like enzyme